MDTFRLKIISPESVEFDDTVESIVVPGEAGSLGVLAHHAPLLSNLRKGRLVAVQVNGKIHKYTIQGGFLEVRNNEAVVLTERLERLNPV